MAVRETARASGRRLRRPRARLRRRSSRAATTAAPSASSPTAAAPTAACRWARSSTQVRRLVESGLSRDRADRRRHHRLGRRPAGPAAAGPAGAAPAARSCRSCRACASPRSTRPRSTTTLWRLLAEEPRLMPHLHLSLQAGDDLILKRMKRRHSRADAIAFCERVRAPAPRRRVRRRPDRRLPDRDRGDVRATRSTLVEDCGLTFLHVFPYSERARHAGRAHAAAARGARAQGARGAPARGGRRGARALPRRPRRPRRSTCWSRSDGFGRSEHYAPVGIRRAGARGARSARDRGRDGLDRHGASSEARLMSWLGRLRAGLGPVVEHG